MAYPYTDTGYNMFDMLSMIQKAIRRGDYENAGFAAEQLKNAFRTAMWNRLLVISAEDCFGVVTKEIVKLREADEKVNDDRNISNAVALLCRGKKSRDACYFACNFVLVSRNPRTVPIGDNEIEGLYRRINGKDGKDEKKSEYDMSGFYQLSLFENFQVQKADDKMYEKKYSHGVMLQKAIRHMDMDMAGYEMDQLRYMERNFLWDVFMDYAQNSVKVPIKDEIQALRKVDKIVNKNKKDKDEIFISKAVILLLNSNDPAINSVTSCEIVHYENTIDWSRFMVKQIRDCILANGSIPEWVYDCHTLKGKKMGKTDWDMTTTEQAALFPLHTGYFDNASWLYSYEQDFNNGTISEEQMLLIREYASNHDANPVKFVPYE